MIKRYHAQEHQDKDRVLFKEAIAEVELDAPEDFWQARDFFKHFDEFEEGEEDIISWSYYGDSDQSELCDDSSVTIKLSTKSKIKSTKTVESRYD